MYDSYTRDTYKISTHAFGKRLFRTVSLLIFIKIRIKIF